VAPARTIDGGVRHGADHPHPGVQSRLDGPDRHAGGDAHHQGFGPDGRADLVEHTVHDLRLDREHEQVRPQGQLAVVLRGGDAVELAKLGQAFAAHVTGPHPALVHGARGEEPAQERAGHVARADQRHVLAVHAA
jgi:hypothetical protein